MVIVHFKNFQELSLCRVLNDHENDEHSLHYFSFQLIVLIRLLEGTRATLHRDSLESLLPYIISRLHHQLLVVR